MIIQIDPATQAVVPRELLRNAMDCLAAAVKIAPPLGIGTPRPVSQWDDIADLLVRELRAALAAPPVTGAEIDEWIAKHPWTEPREFLQARAALPAGQTAPKGLANSSASEPRVLTEQEQAIKASAEKFARLSGRGIHELRLDELPDYLLYLADNYADGPHTEGYFGAMRHSLEIAVEWVASELERKTNDERALAVKLDALRAAFTEAEGGRENERRS